MKKKLYIALAAGMFCMTLATGCEDRLNMEMWEARKHITRQTMKPKLPQLPYTYLSDHNITTGSLSRICYQMICILAEVDEVIMEKWNV